MQKKKLFLITIFFILLVLILGQKKSEKNNTHSEMTHHGHNASSLAEAKKSVIDILSNQAPQTNQRAQSIFDLSKKKYKQKKQATQQLPIPKLIDAQTEKEVVVTAAEGETEFYPGAKSKTYGYNGTFLGPTIKMRKGKTAHIKYVNNLNENTTLHPHGLHVSGDKDGGPQGIIKANSSWSVDYPIIQKAATLWYHPHLMGKTEIQVLKGLAGLIIVEDDVSDSLNIPKDYGVNDIPLILSTRAFFFKKMTTDNKGETLITNGAISPYLDVPKSLVRFRVLNGDMNQGMLLHFADHRTFYKIATDGGFLDKPVAIDKMFITPGERNEILVDFSNGQNADLLTFMLDDQAQKAESVTRALEIRVNNEISAPTYTLPTTLTNTDRPSVEDATKMRNFTLAIANEKYTINGLSMNPTVINERVKQGELELWTVLMSHEGDEDEAHNFHVHGTQFWPVSVSGQPIALEDQGWKDTIAVPHHGTVQFLARWDLKADDSTPYMLHCHFLEHEDQGMMLQFTVE